VIIFLQPHLICYLCVFLHLPLDLLKEETRVLFYDKQLLAYINGSDKAVGTAALRLVRHTGQKSLSKPVDVVGVDGSFVPPGSLLFRSRCSIERCGSHQSHLVVVEDIGWGAPISGSILGEPYGLLPKRNSRINQPQPKGRRNPPLIGPNNSTINSFSHYQFLCQAAAKASGTSLLVLRRPLFDISRWY